MRATSLGVVLFALTVSACQCPGQAKKAEPAKQPPPQPVAAEPAPPPPACDHCGNVVVLEMLAPAEVNENGPFDYTIRVTNVSPTIHATDVAVTDRLCGDGFVYESSVPSGSPTGSFVTWNVGDLNPGEKRDIAVHGRATQSGVLTTCGSVTYATKSCSTTKVVAPALQLTKTAPPDVLACEDIPLRYVVSNSGTGQAVNVHLADELPEGWTVGGNSSVSVDIGTLRAGESREVAVNARSPRTGSFTSNATATADGGLKREAGASTTVRQPKLEITKTPSAKQEVLGHELTVTITVKNTGDATAQDLTISDAVTGAEAFVAISDGGAWSGSAVDWKLGPLAVGAARTLTYTASRSTPGALSGTATAKAVCADAVSASSATAYAGVPAVLLEVVDDPDPILVGGTTTYTISVTNQGTAPGTKIQVICHMDPGVELVSAGGSTPMALPPASVRFETLNQLAPKQVARWTVVVRGTKAGDTRFKVALTTAETERPIEETEATRFYE